MVAEGKGTRARIGMMKAPGRFRSDHPSEGRLRNHPPHDSRRSCCPPDSGGQFNLLRI